jgi:hypothetical protein
MLFSCDNIERISNASSPSLFFAFLCNFLLMVSQRILKGRGWSILLVGMMLGLIIIIIIIIIINTEHFESIWMTEGFVKIFISAHF